MIDPRAVIDPKAELGADVTVGPFAVIGAGVQLGDGCRVGPHAVIEGPTRIGPNNTVFQFASIGACPQDKKYAGEETTLEIGEGNTFREFVTVHRGTAQDKGSTRIGDDNWIMAYCHIAHDCVIGDHTIFSNSASLAGHVIVGDHAILGGFTLVHQFCNIGAHSFCAFGSVVNQDVPPFVTVSGHMAEPHGINSEGLKRRGYDAGALRNLRRAYKILYKSGLRLEEAREHLRALSAEQPELLPLVEFLDRARRGIIR
ncbi:acyl-ACP--UDP-N-acetylglucosamine O-acyltransferase [Alkalilimnicola sp. S0819]|uniref:acyl-ACP--UDP-N-acetylglucosamine O-acyltransferase n=1 Tax=Alkalilimnicola sp. S0819 TaxID=2613922 RepID=UPI00126244EF|nr:acyl-ACP--UDP-N-acetylglucosamine O-acyltransferase [Alkalilimnicola sp. S0819]KAB7627927.1 acyl-ACP--UDP-N-acetylglucosamine O-acyltransferase [Alkalilimnicola sp. S0819]MPQ15564.1 acyl-ACP--UDP-N-acetylglucosamine O-acyltransferase [Alkalilimnicola sp. S0819]